MGWAPGRRSSEAVGAACCIFPYRSPAYRIFAYCSFAYRSPARI